MADKEKSMSFKGGPTIDLVRFRDVSATPTIDFRCERVANSKQWKLQFTEEKITAQCRLLAMVKIHVSLQPVQTQRDFSVAESSDGCWRRDLQDDYERLFYNVKECLNVVLTDF
ncbi:hypothetical protein SUGI_0897310 [Cryptomeria japonica]|nr:hypothetical protein SUGI_0897310 [Cryptomeria japonica]